MKELTFFNGGHPLRIDDLEFMQNAYREVLTGIVKSFAGTNNYVILYGCEYDYGTGDFSEGLMWIDGDLYFHEDENINISQGDPFCIGIDDSISSPSPVIYKDGSSHNVHHIKKASYHAPLNSGGGTSCSNSGTIPYSSFIRIQNSINLVPNNSIIMYNGSASNFNSDGVGLHGTDVEGWQLCNGVNSSPDLRGRFIVGYGANGTGVDATNIWDGDYSTIGNKSTDDGINGSKRQVIPTAKGYTAGTDGNGVDGGSGTEIYEEGRPPWYVLAFIIKK